MLKDETEKNMSLEKRAKKQPNLGEPPKSRSISKTRNP
jgi:hypothetical protein